MSSKTSGEEMSLADEKSLADESGQDEKEIMADRLAPADNLQLQGYLLRLVSRVEQIQEQLNQVSDMVERSGDDVDVLTSHLTNVNAAKSLDEQLAQQLAGMETNQEQLDELNRNVTKLSRTQFKSNALIEVQIQHLSSALATLQEIVGRREEAKQERILLDQERLTNIHSEARSELIADLLPMLDGIELAIENGRALLERRRANREVEKPRPEPPGFLARFNYLINSSAVPFEEKSAPAPDDKSDEALAAWLEGLKLIQERFLGLFAAEGIQPVPTLGQLFDPRLHVALEAVPSTNLTPGSIVSVLRKGYRQGERVLRYAEVTVAREPK